MPPRSDTRSWTDLLESTLESLRDGIVVVDPDGRTLLHNQRFCDIWDFDDELLARQDDGALLEHASSQLIDPAAFLGRVRELYDQPHRETLEDLAMRDGRIIERHGGPVLDEDGSYVGHMWTFRDATAQRMQDQSRARATAMRLDLLDRLEQTNRALDLALTPSEVLLAILRDGVLALGAQTGYVGMLSDDERNLHVSRITAGEDHVEYLGDVPAGAMLPIAESARTGATLLIGNNDQLQCDHPQLERLDANDHACATLPLARRGQVRAVLNIGFDEPRVFDDRDRELFVMLADRASVALDRAMLNHELEQRASASYALEYIGDAVFLLDERDVVRLWNPATAATTGIAADSALGRPVSEVLVDWETIQAQTPVQDASGGAAVAADVEMQRADGSSLIVSISAVRGPAGFVYTFRDVTEAKRLERAKRDFVATVSHELRTPITSIMGGALTLQRTDMQLDEQTRDLLLDTIVTESERLAAIAGQVLLAGTLDAELRSTRFARDAVDVLALASGAIDAARMREPVRTFELDAADDVPAARADATRLRQVLDNLLDNAVRYSEPGSAVRVSVGCRDDRVTIQVADEGIGIAPADQPHVFEMFFRVDASMSRGVGGTGLGLYIAREFVHSMRGTLTVASTGTGEGTTFTVDLARCDESSHSRD